MNKNSKNKRIFEVLWTVDAVLRLSFKAFGVTLLDLKVDKMNWGVIFTKKNKMFFLFFSNEEHPLWKTPEIAGKTRFLIPDVAAYFPK
jgi:hypothetical protein